MSLAPTTQLSYNTYIKKWVAYCISNKTLDPYTATYQEAKSFLAHLFHKEDQKYGAITVARSALSAILPKIGGKTFGQNPNVSRMIKRIFKLRPSLPKYVTTYDPDIILRYIERLPHDEFLLLEKSRKKKVLRKKLCILLCLLSGQHVHSLQALKLSKSNLSNGTFTFYIDKVLKTIKSGKHQKHLEYREFNSNKKLCVVTCLKEYISWTELIRENLKGN